jgi:hypothetical protein
MPRGIPSIENDRYDRAKYLKGERSDRISPASGSKAFRRASITKIKYLLNFTRAKLSRF